MAGADEDPIAQSDRTGDFIPLLDPELDVPYLQSHGWTPPVGAAEPSRIVAVPDRRRPNVPARTRPPRGRRRILPVDPDEMLVAVMQTVVIVVIAGCLIATGLVLMHDRNSPTVYHRPVHINRQQKPGPAGPPAPVVHVRMHCTDRQHCTVTSEPGQ
jgi:hypothetical protein